MASPIIDVDTSAAQTGWTYFTGTQWEAFPAGGCVAGYYGQRIAYAFQSVSISRGVVYYIRFRQDDGTSPGDWTGDEKSW